MKELRQVHILPTEDGVISKCLQGYSDDPLLTFKTGQLRIETDGHKDWWENQNLYITSDEEIKVHDYYIEDGELGFIYKRKGSYTPVNGRKVIATTAKFGLPQIDQDFIKLFCDKGGIWEVDVEYVLCAITDGSYKVNTTEIESVYLPKLINNTIIISEIEEKMFSKEEVISFGKKCSEFGYNNMYDNEGQLTEEWIKENL